MTYIGTSGWHYRHWRGPFYPQKLPASKWLDFYSLHFDTVELNNTFYRLPRESFFERLDCLRPKLGPIVFQLPPFWDVDPDRLDSFLRALPHRHRYAFEFRNPTWHTEDTHRILRKYNAAFCIFEIAGFASRYHLTADFTYVRLHGPEGAYQGSYSESTLERWAARIGEWRKQLRAVYIYFDNDQEAHAVENALALKRLLA